MKYINLIELRVVLIGLLTSVAIFYLGHKAAAALCLVGSAFTVVSIRTYSILSNRILSGDSIWLALILIALKLVGVLIVLVELRTGVLVEQGGFILGLLSFVPGALIPGERFRKS